VEAVAKLVLNFFELTVKEFFLLAHHLFSDGLDAVDGASRVKGVAF
jgi:hypothetical protein